jgi:hypothetical protein
MSSEIDKKYDLEKKITLLYGDGISPTIEDYKVICVRVPLLPLSDIEKEELVNELWTYPKKDRFEVLDKINSESSLL